MLAHKATGSPHFFGYGVTCDPIQHFDTIDYLQTRSVSSTRGDQRFQSLGDVVVLSSDKYKSLMVAIDTVLFGQELAHHAHTAASNETGDYASSDLSFFRFRPQSSKTQANCRRLRAHRLN